MKRTILILEDNAERAEAMKAWLSDRLYMFAIEVFDHPKPLIERLQASIEEVTALSLDHDLNDTDFTKYPGGDATGMDVVRYLQTIEPVFPVIVHSTNSYEAATMVSKLKKNRWAVERIVPFNGISWIGNDWLPTLKRLLENSIAERLSTAG
ncbi:MAG: response regulator [Planctomycetia bacterium]|nr:response regulator [Planctomycetia bacterium]